MIGQTKDMIEATRRAGVQATKALGRITSAAFLKTVQGPSIRTLLEAPPQEVPSDLVSSPPSTNWEGLILAAQQCAVAGYPASELGVYLQPIVRGQAAIVSSTSSMIRKIEARQNG